MRERRNRNEQIDVGGHRFRAAPRTTAFEREAAGFDPFDESLPVFENAHVDHVARYGHEALTRHPPELRDPQIEFAVNRDPGRILSR